MRGDRNEEIRSNQPFYTLQFINGWVTDQPTNRPTDRHDLLQKCEDALKKVTHRFEKKNFFFLDQYSQYNSRNIFITILDLRTIVYLITTRKSGVIEKHQLNDTSIVLTLSVEALKGKVLSIDTIIHSSLSCSTRNRAYL